MVKIGIIVYSQTENTYSVALKLQEKFQENGQEAEVERVLIAGETAPRAKNVEFQNLPDTAAYDALVLGAPVHAFSLAAPMKLYLEQVDSLQDKKIACFVTKGLKFNWTGGNQAIGKIKKICESKGGKIVGTDIVVWNKSRDKKIQELLAKFSVLF
jgi:flavodoxin